MKDSSLNRPLVWLVTEEFVHRLDVYFALSMINFCIGTNESQVFVVKNRMKG